MGLFGAIGRAFKNVGKGAWWVAQRPETQLVVSAFWPAAIFTKTMSLVKLAEHQGFESGTAKKAWVLGLIAEVAFRAGINKPADLEKLIEDALAVVERRAQVER